MPAQTEEVVLPSHSLYLQHFRPHRRYRRLHFSFRCLICPHSVCIPLRRRQSLPVQLPVQRLRHLLHPHIRSRHHVPRQPSSQILPQLFRSHSSFFCSFAAVAFSFFSCFCSFFHRVVRHQPLLSSLLFPRHHCRFLDPLILRQPRLNLSQLDPIPPHLHLIIIPP